MQPVAHYPAGELRSERSGGAIGQKKPSCAIIEAERLVPPPKEELMIMLHLAQMGDLSALSERAVHIETLGGSCVAFASRQRALAEGSKEREILALIKGSLQSLEVES
jgi:hypothetical protein